MFTALKNFFGNLFSREDVVGTKLNWVSLTFLVGFAIFFIFEVSQGMDYQGARAVQPEAVVPEECHAVVFGLTTQQTDAQLAEELNAYQHGHEMPAHGDGEDKQVLLPACAALFTAMNNFDAAPRTLELGGRMRDLANKISETQNKIDDFRREHAQFLEERAAGVTNSADTISDLPADIRATFTKDKAALAAFQAELDSVQKELVATPAAQQLIALAQKNKAEVVQKYVDLEYWQPVYATLYQALLIFPLLFVCVFCYRLAQRREWPILRALTANASMIASLYALWILLETIYWVLPHRLLATVYEFLATIGLLAFWSYGAILLGIVLFGGLIYASQRGAEKWRTMQAEKKQREILANLARVQKERALRGVCVQCETQVKPGQHFCGVCGTQLLLPCPKCRHEFSPALGFCDACGAARK